jgi:MFS family permease
MSGTARPRRVMLPLGLAACLSLFGDLSLYAVLITQVDALGLGLASVGIMLSINRLVRIPGNPLAGLLYDRWGRRNLFLLGMLLGVLSTAGYGLVVGFWPFLLTRLAWGIAWTLINVGGMSMVIDVSTRANRGRWMGTFNTWILAGLALGPMVGGPLVELVGFRSAMLICASLTLLGLAVAAMGLPETAIPQASTAQPRPPVEEIWRRRLARYWQQATNAVVHGDRGILIASALYLIVQFCGDGIVLSTLSLLLQRRFGAQVSIGGLVVGIGAAAGLMLGIRSLLAGAAGPYAGHLSDTRLGRWPVIGCSLGLGIAGFGLLAFATAPGIMLAGVALAAIGSGTALATLAAVVGDLTPARREGAVMGLYATAGDLGSAAGPVLAFALLAALDLKWIYLLCSVAFLIGLWLILDLRRRQTL